MIARTMKIASGASSHRGEIRPGPKARTASTTADNPVAKRYDVHAMPDTLFIDAQGVVRDRVYGQTDTVDLRRAIDRLLDR